MLFPCRLVADVDILLKCLLQGFQDLAFENFFHFFMINAVNFLEEFLSQLLVSVPNVPCWNFAQVFLKSTIFTLPQIVGFKKSNNKSVPDVVVLQKRLVNCFGAVKSSKQEKTFTISFDADVLVVCSELGFAFFFLRAVKV